MNAHGGSILQHFAQTTYFFLTVVQKRKESTLHTSIKSRTVAASAFFFYFNLKRGLRTPFDK